MTLAGGNEINQVHAEVFNFRVWLVARMLGFGLWWWSSFRIASIHGNGWIHGADHIIRIAGDVCFFPTSDAQSNLGNVPCTGTGRQVAPLVDRRWKV